MAVKPQPKQDANKPREEGAEPLMDGMNTAMRKMLAKAKEKGFVTSAELNAVLPSADQRAPTSIALVVDSVTSAFCQA